MTSTPDNDDSEFSDPSLARQALNAVDLVDQLLIAHTDLERLNALIGAAATDLLGAFFEAEHALATLPDSAPPAALRARSAVARAITAMQFSDMASQILTHVGTRIEAVTDRLGAIDEDEPTMALVERTCPVAQREMDAGSVELF